VSDVRSRCAESEAMRNLVGNAAFFTDAIEQIPEIAQSEASVLITGETGTGKELIARALHQLSPRRARAFVTLNCGSFCESLLEDELFGHERGAFTSATSRRDGLIAQAELGTLFLDEVDSLPAKAQTDLLRVLQNKTYRPVGSSIERKANVRVLAASNAPVTQLVKSGMFRADLFHRLCVFHVELPPLRFRRQDIPLLINHFLQKHAPAGRPVTLSEESRAELVSRDWPGNIRELENIILRALHLRKTDRIEVRDLGLHFSSFRNTTPSARGVSEIRSLKDMKKEMIANFEKEYLIRLMSEFGGNVSRAAQAAQKERRDLGKLLRKYHVDPKSFCPAKNCDALRPILRATRRTNRLPEFTCERLSP
jgi:two-component system, NtrC family, response regulator GlrR